MNEYFSDRENGPRARIEQKISSNIWKWITDYTNRLLNDGAFGSEFPEHCDDHPKMVTGNDSTSFNTAVKAEIPELKWPPEDNHPSILSKHEDPELPNTEQILDLIEFIHKNIARPIKGDYHSYHKHHHLAFDRKKGQTEFRDQINKIFQRNGLAYKLEDSGKITRTLDPTLGPAVANALLNSEDKDLDHLLEESRTKFFSRSPSDHRVALENLWRAWERIKSMANEDKKKSVNIIIKTLASETTLQDRLDKEAKELTEIGNSYFIRHTEVNQKPLTDPDQIDYLFYRMFAMILLMLSKIDKWKTKR